MLMQNDEPIKKFTVAEFISGRIAVSRLTQKELAKRLGYDKPNIITMFKQGLTKVPVERVPKLAELLECDPLMLLQMVMNEYKPGEFQAIMEICGLPISKNERETIEIIRKVSGKRDPDPNYKNNRKLIEDAALLME
jgi:transcriptional regulator with XRE-family HTH domain